MNTATIGVFPSHLTFSLPVFDVRRDQRLGFAIALSILVHVAWLGWLPGWNTTEHPPAPLLTVRLANPPPQLQPVTTVSPPHPERSTLGVSTATPRITEPRYTAVAQTRPEIPTPVIAIAPSPEPVATPAFRVPVVQAPAPLAAPATPVIEKSLPAQQPTPATIDTGSLAGYGRDIAGAVARHQRYPRIAQARQWQGTALLRLSITADGKLADIRVQTSSGHEVLDRQALDMVRESLPLPPLPATLAGHPVSVDVPVTFRLAS